MKIPQKEIAQVIYAFEPARPEKELDVDLLLVSAPTRTFKGKLARCKIAGEASVARDSPAGSEPVVLASVRIDGPDIPEAARIPRELLIPGTEIHAGSAAATVPWVTRSFTVSGNSSAKKWCSCSDGGEWSDSRSSSASSAPLREAFLSRRGAERAERGQPMLTRLGLILIVAAPIPVVAYCLGCFDFLTRVAPREAVHDPSVVSPPVAEAKVPSEPEVLPCSLTVPAAEEGPLLGAPTEPGPLPPHDGAGKLALEPLEDLPVLAVPGTDASCRKAACQTASLAGTPAVDDPLALPETLTIATTPLPALTPVTARAPIVIPGCRLTVIEKQEVASQRDGILAMIGTEVTAGEEVPPDRLITVQVGKELKKYRRLKEDDPVTAGQLLARLDDRLARDEVAIKQDRLQAAEADLVAAEKSRDEARERYLRQMQLRAAGEATSEEEIANARLAWTKEYYEAVNKKKSVDLARLELSQARTVLEMHEIRSTISGVIKAICKNPGEAVKTYEPVFQIRNLSRPAAEGMLDAQFLTRLHKGMPAVIEIAQDESPLQVLLGHTQEVTGVAVTGDPNPRSLSPPGRTAPCACGTGKPGTNAGSCSIPRPFARWRVRKRGQTP